MERTERTASRNLALPWLAGFLAASYGAAALGGLFTSLSIRSRWYRSLRRPSWSPPDWVFGPVWAVLYGLMAVSAWLTRRAASEDPSRRQASQRALTAWSIQLALNVAWSAIFFGGRSLLGGVVCVGALRGAIVSTVILTGRVTRLGAVLLLPYLAWVTFASILNNAIWSLNRRRERSG